jgi:hypothetical protein
MTMATVERLYVVEWSADGHGWWIVKDLTDGTGAAVRLVPAAYDTASEAEQRRSAMAEQFSEFKYRVVGFEHGGDE